MPKPSPFVFFSKPFSPPCPNCLSSVFFPKPFSTPCPNPFSPSKISANNNENLHQDFQILTLISSASSSQASNTRGPPLSFRNLNPTAIRRRDRDQLEEGEVDEFGDDVYAIPEQLGDPAQCETDEEEFIDVSASDSQRQLQSGRGFDPRMTGRGRLETKTPPSGYICNRCKVPGHFIQHCPTNGDPDYNNRGNLLVQGLR